jgi:hypothetical protein
MRRNATLRRHFIVPLFVGKKVLAVPQHHEGSGEEPLVGCVATMKCSDLSSADLKLVGEKRGFFSIASEAIALRCCFKRLVVGQHNKDPDAFPYLGRVPTRTPFCIMPSGSTRPFNRSFRECSKVSFGC